MCQQLQKKKRKKRLAVTKNAQNAFLFLILACIYFYILLCLFFAMAASLEEQSNWQIVFLCVLFFVFPVLLLFLEQVKQIAQSLSEINQIKMQPEPQILRNQQANTSRTEFANEIENESKLKTYRGCVYFFGV